LGTTAQPQPQAQAPAQPQSQTQVPPKADLALTSSSFDKSKDPYAALLPSNYLDLLPKAVKDAFASKEFQWGHVPEWIPPPEMR
jgi:nucleoporin NUP42